jgi:hypothetical protein
MSEDKKERYSKWMCELCSSTFITDCQSRWDMVYCDCGKSSVDDEEYYTRFFGKPKLVLKSNNINDLKDEA